MRTRNWMTVVALLVAAPTYAARGETAAKLDLAKEALKQHYDTQRLIAAEEADWRLAKDLIGSRVGLLEAQIEELKKRTAEEEAKTTEADGERIKLLDELESLEEIRKLQEERVGDLEKSARILLAMAPQVRTLQERLTAIGERIPDSLEVRRGDVTASIAQRFANVLGVLKLMSDFNRNITLSTETVTLDDGRRIEVTTLYLGLGQAYFSGGSEEDPVCGTGTPWGYGWAWKESKEHATEIRRLIGVYEGTEPPDFVRVPVTIR